MFTFDAAGSYCRIERSPEHANLVFWLVLLLAIGPTATSSAQSTGALGSEFQVNSYTTNLQYQPRVGYQSDGDFVVVWVSGSYSTDGIDGDAGGISLQLFNSDGSAHGAELQVNTFTAGPQRNPSLGVAASDEFVVVWDGYGSAGSDVSSSSIHGRRFASDGTPIGDEFQVNDYTTDRQREPEVAVDPAGGFVVTWEDLGFSFPFDGRDGSGPGVFGRRFASDGSPLGIGFQVNAYSTATQQHADVAADADGDFVVTWTHEDEISGRRFASNATPLGGDFQVNTYTTNFQERSSISVSPDGAFVVTWFGYGPDDPNTAILARRYASDGTALGSEFQVNTHFFVGNHPPPIALTPNGGFIVAWESFRFDGPDTDSGSIQIQRHAAVGSRLGAELQVNTYTTGNQNQPALATRPDGGFVVIWTSEGSSGSDGDSLSVQGQRFDGIIFTDGFESGDTTAWSSTST